MWCWYRREGQQWQHLSHICWYTNIHRKISMISPTWRRNFIVYALLCVRFLLVHLWDIELYFYRCRFDNDSAFTETDMSSLWHNLDKIVFPGCTGICVGNLQCSQWRIFHQNDIARFIGTQMTLNMHAALCSFVKNIFLIGLMGFIHPYSSE